MLYFAIPAEEEDKSLVVEFDRMKNQARNEHRGL